MYKLFVCLTFLFLFSCKKDTPTPSELLNGKYTRNDYKPDEVEQGKYDIYTFTATSDSTANVVHRFTKREDKTKLIPQVLDAIKLDFINDLFNWNSGPLQFYYQETGELAISSHENRQWTGIISYSKKTGTPDAGTIPEIEFKTHVVPIEIAYQAKGLYSIHTPDNGNNFLYIK